MRQLAIFTTPEEAHVELRHDSGRVFHGAPGRADGRFAHILLIDGVPDGHGARLVVTHHGFVPVEQRGILWLTRLGDRAEFVVDDVYLSATFGGGAGSGPLRVEGSHFMQADQRFLVRGSTDFRLAECVLTGRDIRPFIADRVEAGANWVRVLGMKTNNTGWALNPRSGGYWDAVRTTFGLLGDAAVFCEWVVFADTAAIMPDSREQLEHYARTCELAREIPHVLIELVNEAQHPTQRLDPRRFSRPEGVLASHGSGLTDAPAVKPYWDYATYHGRRMARPDDARAAVAYSPFGFEEDWPKPCPMINEESAKPPAYGFNPAYARLMGLHARCANGGTFHHDSWNEPRLFNNDERACAMAFYGALQGA